MQKNKFAIFIASFMLLSAAKNILAAGEYIYDSKGKRDPFIALVTPDGRLVKLEDEAPKSTTLSLEGIIYDINGLS
ncbi:MAG: hypothetical protein ACM3IL_02725, partial [Deltaproteobacteria bacterium]